MLIILFHLALIIALLWYQRKQDDHPRPLALTIVWEVVSILLSLIQAYVLEGTWHSDSFAQSLVLGLFYLPAVYFTFRIARRQHLPLWRAFMAFFLLAAGATLIAAMLLAYVPIAHGWSS